MSDKLIVSEKSARLDVFLAEKLAISRSKVKSEIDSGNILLNGKKVKAGMGLNINDIIDINFEEKSINAVPQDIPLDIVYEDDDLLVINKPQGLVVHPGNGNRDNTLVNALLFHIKNLSSINGSFRPGIVHRIDKNTSGLLLVAKNDFAHQSLAKQIANKTCKREYFALLEGILKEQKGTITSYLTRNINNRVKMASNEDGNGKLAITNFEVVKYYEGFTLVKFSLQTGRTHQIRVHASEILHRPIVGDDVYGAKYVKNIMGQELKGQLLHAYKIEFCHPRTNNKMEFEIPLPKYFEKVLAKLK